MIADPTSNFFKKVLTLLGLGGMCCFGSDPSRVLVVNGRNNAAKDVPARPNVLLIVTDDQRPDTIAALGNEIIDTPNLDRLVKRGMTFEQATCANPLCVPSRAEILSGCSSFRNGVLGMGTERIDPKLSLLPSVMAGGGYHAWYVGKWMNDGKPLTRGYQETRGLFSSGGGTWKKGEVILGRKGRHVTGY